MNSIFSAQVNHANHLAMPTAHHCELVGSSLMKNMEFHTGNAAKTCQTRKYLECDFTRIRYYLQVATRGWHFILCQLLRHALNYSEQSALSRWLNASVQCGASSKTIDAFQFSGYKFLNELHSARKVELVLLHAGGWKHGDVAEDFHRRHPMTFVPRQGTVSVNETNSWNWKFKRNSRLHPSKNPDQTADALAKAYVGLNSIFNAINDRMQRTHTDFVTTDLDTYSGSSGTRASSVAIVRRRLTQKNKFPKFWKKNSRI